MSPSPSLWVLCQKLSPGRRTPEPYCPVHPVSSLPSVAGRTSRSAVPLSPSWTIAVLPRSHLLFSWSLRLKPSPTVSVLVCSFQLFVSIQIWLQGSAAEEEPACTWGPSQQRAFDLVKDELSKTSVFVFYDPNREKTVSADTSFCGLGAVLWRRTDAIRPDSDDVDRAGIFPDWEGVVSDKVKTRVVHRLPLQRCPFLCKRNTTRLYHCSLQRRNYTNHRHVFNVFVCVWCDAFTLSVMFQGRISDALSLAPQERLYVTSPEVLLTYEVTAQANLVGGAFSATEKRLREIRAKTTWRRQVMRYCVEGWPTHPSLPSVLRPYCQVQNDLTTQNWSFLKVQGGHGHNPDMLQAAGNVGQTAWRCCRCRSRAQYSVW